MLTTDNSWAETPGGWYHLAIVREQGFRTIYYVNGTKEWVEEEHIPQSDWDI